MATSAAGAQSGNLNIAIYATFEATKIILKLSKDEFLKKLTFKNPVHSEILNVLTVEFNDKRLIECPLEGTVLLVAVIRSPDRFTPVERETYIKMLKKDLINCFKLNTADISLNNFTSDSIHSDLFDLTQSWQSETLLLVCTNKPYHVCSNLANGSLWHGDSNDNFIGMVANSVEPNVKLTELKYAFIMGSYYTKSAAIEAKSRIELNIGGIFREKADPNKIFYIPAPDQNLLNEVIEEMKKFKQVTTLRNIQDLVVGLWLTRLKDLSTTIRITGLKRPEPRGRLTLFGKLKGLATLQYYNFNYNIERLEPFKMPQLEGETCFGKSFKFKTVHDAENAVKELDGTMTKKQRLKVTMAESLSPFQDYIKNHSLTVNEPTRTSLVFGFEDCVEDGGEPEVINLVMDCVAKNYKERPLCQFADLPQSYWPDDFEPDDEFTKPVICFLQHDTLELAQASKSYLNGFQLDPALGKTLQVHYVPDTTILQNFFDVLPTVVEEGRRRVVPTSAQVDDQIRIAIETIWKLRNEELPRTVRFLGSGFNDMVLIDQDSVTYLGFFKSGH
jgi:hypothetical protein